MPEHLSRDDIEEDGPHGVWVTVCGHCGHWCVTVAPIELGDNAEAWPLECCRCGVFAMRAITKWQAIPCTN